MEKAHKLNSGQSRNKIRSKKKNTNPSLEIPPEYSLSGMTWELLGATEFMLHKPNTSYDFYEAIMHGFPKLSIDFLAKALQIPMTKMAILLNLSYKTLTRKKKMDKMDIPVSSHAFEIAETLSKGLALFENKEKLNNWLNKENRALNGARPFNLLNNPTGIKMVNQILGRIEEGIYS